MEKYSPEWRLSVYQNFLKEIDNRWSPESDRRLFVSGFCNMYYILYKNDSEAYYTFSELFPELYKRKTRNGTAWFFRSWEERHEALVSAIQELVEELKKEVQ